ncbi:glycosyltransferase [Metallumcola ferriviriculae]|uniref:Glycosyltransferase n=1 Tax=Metallumcola ferriviriculae TaxID=3039180 RepID=A0AAU0ULR4_9FIRM|nr:glycosyltransferase [Desulfitibacteraceae bacterium MK1]
MVESFAGGVLTSVSQLCNVQVFDQNDVFLAYSMRQETPSDFSAKLDPRIQTIRINLVRQIAPYRDLLGLFEMRKILKKVNPDILHLHSSKAGLIGRLANRMVLGKKIKVFYSPRGFGFLQLNVRSLKQLMYFYIEKFGTNLGGITVACSASEAKEASRLRKNNIIIIENAVDTDIIPKKDWSCEQTDVIKIGTVGRLCPQKNPQMFEQLVMNYVHRDNVAFCWIGGGNEGFKFQTQKNITLTGWLPREDALTYLSTLDIYIQTSLWEGMPLSVIEAMVSGIPAVVTDVVGNRDVIEHGRTGFIARNLKEMVDYVDLLTNDSKLRMEMGQWARDSALERFGLHRLRQDITQLYRGNYSIL